MSFRHPLRAACLAPLCLIVQLAFLVAPHAAYAVGTADGYVSVGTTTNPTSEFGVYGGATIGSSYNNMLAPTNGLLVQGNVGIGTTGPAPGLEVNNNTSTGGVRVSGSNAPGITFTPTPGIAGFNAAIGYATGASQWVPNSVTGDFIIRNSNHNIDFTMDGGSSIGVIFTSAGAVGIGTTSPQALLHVYDSADNNGVALQANVTGAFLDLGQGTTNAYMRFGAYNNVNNLDSKARDFRLFSTAAPTGLNFQASSGNVGIGTTSPSATLSITGGTVGNGLSSQMQVWPTRVSFQQAGGDQINAGQIDYAGFDGNALSIIGKGTGGANRGVRIYDALGIGYSPNSTTGALLVNGNVGIGGLFR